MGDTVTNLTGVLDFAFNTYRVRSVEDGSNVFADANPRQAEPDDVGGTIQIGSFNVLNFFRTLNDGSMTANGLEPRGANTTAEFERQVDKLVNVLTTLDADVLGLIELENNFLPSASGNAIEFLVNELNAELGAGTYAWVNPGQQFVGGDAIAVGFIYKPSVVEISVGTTIQILDDSDLPGLGLGNLITNSTVGGVFNGVNTSRAAVAVTFEEVATGGEFTAVVNHLKSKSGTGTGNDADQLDGQGNWQQQREFAATALTEWIETDPTGSGDDDFLIIGDLNAYFMEDTIDIIKGAGFENLQETLSDPYSFVFDGQVGALDYILGNGSMADQVTGVTEWHINSDEADALDYNLDFGRDPAIFDAEALARVSDHDPLLVGLDLVEQPVFRLQILHGSDFEAGLAAIDDAPRFAAIADRLEDLEVNSITLASGDNYIPSPFFNASSDPALDPFFEESIGRGDIRILNTIGIEASVIGNHEFDAGPREVQNLIRPVGPGADGGGAYEGTQFGYLAANLNFAGEPDLAPNAGTTPITEATFGTGASGGRRLGPSMILEENGELIGVVGVTTPVFEDITTPGGVRIIGPRTLDANDGDDSDFIALAQIVQDQIDVLTGQGINKIVIVSQLQELENEQHLISFLEDVDVVVGGGSNTLLSDGTDVLRTGDTSDGPYAQIFTNGGGDQTVLVNTDGNYKYVGRLVVEFDDQGHIIPASLDPNINGAYATDQAGLDRVYQGTGIDPFAEGSRGDTVRDLTTVIDGIISVKDGVQFGSTDVYLEGRRATIRSQETNLGNLSADANLYYAKQTDPGVTIAIKNGGGIRDSIGSIAPDGSEQPPVANPDANKQAGEVSQLDIENSLRFNNALSLVTLTPQQLLEALENGVSNPGGIFAHVGGLRFSYNSSLPAGNRVQTVALVDENDQVTAVVVQNGDVVADAPAAIRMVTLTFLIGTPNASQPGGFNRPDGFKFAEYIAADPSFANRVDLDGDASGADDVAARTGAATFTDNGREQDAFAEYLAAKYSVTPYQEVETPQSGDTRIQNLTVREDTVLEDNVNDAPMLAAVAGATYTDTVGNDMFTAVSGMLDGDDPDSSPLIYGIDGGTTGLSTTIGGTVYDVARVSNFGTLHVASASGDYIFVPRDTAIEALKTATTQSFTFTVSAGSASASQNFVIAFNGADDAPVAAMTNLSLQTNEWAQLQGRVGARDSDDAITQYQFYDAGADAGSGYFWTADAGLRAANTYITIDAADLGTTWVRGGAVTGGELMWVRAFNGTTWSDWDPFTLTTSDAAPGPNTAPVATVNDQTLQIDEAIGLETLISVSDADGDTITQYQLYDSGTAADSGYFFSTNGGQRPAGEYVTIGAADLDAVELRAGQATGSELMWVRAFDGVAWSAWDAFTLVTQDGPNAAPVVTIDVQSLQINGTAAVTSFISITDADGDAITQYQFYDAESSASSGYFSTNGTQRAADTYINVTAADLAGVELHGGTVPGTELMWVRGFDGTAWSEWDPFFLNTALA